MKRSWSIIVACVFTITGEAQNLVPNGSFEVRDTCAGPGVGYAMYATGWMNLHTQSADYFNACNSGGVVDVPYSQFGYQVPYEGDAYVGMATSSIGGGPWYREMVGIELLEPLQPGVPVCLSFKAAVGGFGSWSGNSAYNTCKGIGLKFFSALPNDWQDYLYPNSAAVYLDEVPTDTSSWYTVDGTYVPDSAYTFVLVGNFFADSLSEVTVLDSTGFGAFEPSYVFVDDVRVSFALGYCTEEVAVPEVGGDQPIVYPLPCADVLHVRLPVSVRQQLCYSMRDMAGRVVLQGQQAGGSGEVLIATERLPSGVYVLQLTTTYGSWSPITVVHGSP
ncbi:MAG: T9SS type A sorting domain-containing protein [Flavobacteriales bacterium]|nr:T9SS type A sorting domain-containing protein [Flavobacteriales bacterium]